MTSLRNLRIGTRLALGFAIVLGLTVVCRGLLAGQRASATQRPRGS